MGQVDLGSVHNLFARPVASGDADRLRTVMGLLASGVPWLAGLSAAAILRLRQFVAGIINHILLRAVRRQWKVKADESAGKQNEREQQKAFDDPSGKNPAIGEYADGRFSG
jgi:hypothetical protein